jgi:hypothetical protein
MAGALTMDLIVATTGALTGAGAVSNMVSNTDVVKPMTVLQH